MKGDVHLSGRRVMRKIKLGKARPAIFYQFDTLVELSDGSVIKRWSQAPKDEIRMINDQRNSLLWNQNRSDLATSDPNAAGKINRFKQKFTLFDKTSKDNTDAEKDINETFIDLMGQNIATVVSGGKLYDKKQQKKKK